MNGPPHRPVILSPYEATLDATPVDGAAAPRKCRVELVEASASLLSSEMYQLLRSRLRAASLVLCFGFWVFLIRNFFVLQFDQRPSLFLATFHAVVVLVLGFCAVTLCRSCPSSPRILRTKELLIFGLPAAFILAFQIVDVMHWRAHGGYLESPVAPWLILIFTYAMFIPNTWRRAGTAIAAMAVTPVAMYLFFWLQESHVRETMSGGQLLSLALMMVLAAVVSVFGVYTINRLRREAFEARQLGQYRLRHLIGAGGMGEVYLAEHQLMKRPCAIKLIRPGKAADPQALARFEREVRAMARLSHWNTVEVFDYGQTEDGTFYYVMEYLPGLSLAELVERYGPLAQERVVSLLEQTCDALGEAHALGLIHRDIKPGNIFAAQRGGVYDVAKLLDFGLAKPLLPDDSAQLTIDGTITGSPLYMSPEQASDEREPDARSDIYSLGAVAYYLLTGQPPFNEEKPMKVLIAHVRDDVIPPSHHRPEIAADLEAIVMRCLAKDPRDRYQDTAELASALKGSSVSGLWTRKEAAQWWAQYADEDNVPTDDSMPGRGRPSKSSRAVVAG